MIRGDSVDNNRTYHPTVADGAYGKLFGTRGRSKPEDTTGVQPATETGASSAFSGHEGHKITFAPEFVTVITETSGSRKFSWSLGFGETVSIVKTIISENRTANPEIIGLPTSPAGCRSTLSVFKNEVLAWRSQLSKPHTLGLNKRLEYLFEDEPESSASQALPDINSFGVLLAFLARHHEVKTPSLGYNRDGVFSGTWIGAKRLRLSLDFISSSSIRWIYVDSRSGLKEAATGAGVVPIEILPGVLNAYGAFAWMKS